MQENRDVVLNGTPVNIQRFDRVAFHPYSSIYYEVHGFDVFSDSQLIAVYDNLNIVSKNINDLAGIIKVDKRPTWKDRRNNRHRENI